MKRIVCLIGFAIWGVNTLYAQLYDRNWVVGRPSMCMQFDHDTIHFFRFNKLIGALGSTGCMSDKEGNFLFATQGTAVYNIGGDTIINGIKMMDSFFSLQGQYPYYQGIISLPKKDSAYYIVQYSVSDSMIGAFGGNYPYPDNLYYAVVDMSQNSGKGKVISKRNLIFHGRQGDSRLTACLHANGRDWWLVNHGFCDNSYHVYFVNPDSIFSNNIQNIGPVFCESDFIGQGAFSPDGTKYASTIFDSIICLLDFDRCTGVFSNSRTFGFKSDTIYIPPDTNKYYFTTSKLHDAPTGLSFSPNNRFLYVSSYYRVRQFDVQSLNIFSSAKSLFFDDYVHDKKFTGFANMFLAPNGKIYICSYQGGEPSLSVIDSPNQVDTACHFRLHSFFVGDSLISATGASNIPTTFRLGALKGSGCDTITTGVNDVPMSKIVVSPNPSHTSLSVSLRQYERDAKLYIYDALGREMYSNKHFYLDDYVDVRTYPVGVYYLRMCSASAEYGTKFVKE